MSRLYIGKEFMAVRVVMAWNRLPREAVTAPSLDASKARLGLDQSGIVEDVPAYGWV